MQNFKGQKKIYAERISNMFKSLNAIDIDWIDKRRWFASLEAFSLGENFFDTVLHSDGIEETDPEKINFCLGTLVYAQIEFEQKLKREHKMNDKKNRDLSSGVDIEEGLSLREGVEHEGLLGFLWWKAIKGKAMHQFNNEEKETLEKKEKELAETISRTQFLSVNEIVE